MSNQRTEISTLGEFGLIDRIKSSSKQYNKSTVKGIDDDAAVIEGSDKNAVTLVSTDQLVEGIHFDLSYLPLKHLGYKSITVNLSDIAAMNAIPRQVTVNMALSNRFSVEAVDELYEGIRIACDNYKVDLIGGDTSASPGGLYLSVTAIGEAEKDKVTYRSGAKKNDIICVTGDLGAAYLGLQVLEREKQVFLTNPEMQPKLEGYDYIIQRHMRPEARTDIIYEFQNIGIVPTSMMDISDGLASEIIHICMQSGVGARIFEDKLPIDQRTFDAGFEFKIDPTTCALNGGEDYELLFTIGQDDYEKIKNHNDIHFIGYISEKKEGAILITKNENVVPIQAQGWVHFQKGE